MQEIFTYPWMSEEFVNALMPSTEGILALSTPPSPTEKFMRSSLLPNICHAIVKNERNFDEFDIFEEAQVFLDKDYTENYNGERLPAQKKHLGCAFVGKAENIGELFRRAKGVIGSMPGYTHMEGFTFEKSEKPYWADEVVWQNIYLGEKHIGDIALLSKKAALACGIKVLSAVLVELDMDALVPFKSRTNRYERLAEFPVNEYDISFLVDSSVKWSEVYETIVGKKSSESLLKDALFVDEYRGKQIPEGKKSLTARLVISSSEKTLTGQEIEAVAASAIKRIGKRFGADMRTK
jgi:phenylalanyl-tRNA synthetase beta chain